MLSLNLFLLLTASTVSPTFAAVKDASNRGCWAMEEKYFKFGGIREYMSNGECKIICGGKNLPVAAMSKQNECYCSDRLPQTQAKPEDCDAGCTGFGEPCGSITGEYISVFVTGKGKLVTPVKPSTSSTSAAPTKTADGTPSAIKSETPTKEPSEKEEEKKSSGGVSKGTAAAAAVVSILVAAAIAIGGFILFRRRQRERIEEEYRRTLAARDFTKKPEMDHRLEPVMLHRRDSVGSIADNEDYSRRILKVTNPDG